MKVIIKFYNKWYDAAGKLSTLSRLRKASKVTVKISTELTVVVFRLFTGYPPPPPSTPR
jgi:hypothetical protein